MKVWLDGRVVDEAEATVSVRDHGFTVGDGVFETMRVYAGRPFTLDRHLERLAGSAAALGLVPPTAEVLAAAVAAVVSTNALLEAVLRITVTGGPGPMGSGRGDAGPTVVVTAGAFTPWPATAAVWVAPWPRNERSAVAGVKTTSYAENVVALAWAQERGAGEALVANLAGHLCEGTGSNVFVARGGRLLTPRLSAGCLAGVTRALLLEAGLGDEADLTVAELQSADEAFLTSSTREVQPIATVDGRPLQAAPGPLTAAAAALYAGLIRRAGG
ncbi:MAG: aminotransferase class IV [Acidimicrobiales bacterium]